ncbi:MAG: L-glutamate gamma-semialdehyde dehydrogenase [Alphaproteobacteria bacterium]|nr:L-glutamate gamma-semialdehyde dehydrogenase [Alphaproteobacteria bacterium]MDE2493072.1 L-glutamate gamma-semialdehyde dehydrogenase [Alphaproteobacteria bacterium]
MQEPKSGEYEEQSNITSWDLLDRFKYQDEAQAIAALLKVTPPIESRDAVLSVAKRLIAGARHGSRQKGVVECFLRQFSLSTNEGLALMGLAEALLRTPDTASKDRLIAEKICTADWAVHLGQSDSLLVNASTWGLMLTGRLIDVSGMDDAVGTIRILAARVGEPVVRAAVTQAVRIMGEQFVLGRTIEMAFDRATKEKLVCSFDMLGEGARTEADAQRYEAAYTHAIATISKDTRGPEAAHGISVKLSALSPRYEPSQETRIWRELYPRVRRLADLAAQADINFTLDAEEADRLVLSLKLLDKLAREPALGKWRGLGVAVQAYQKRAPKVVAALAALARETERRLMVRLVKGAYWDSEIKRAQMAGRPGYPVFTTKPATDMSYLVCARILVDASPHLYGQFATHNAHTLAAVRAMAKARGVMIEHQRLHGMGEALYEAAQREFGRLSLRTYAPVGVHEDLLPYLVRRLLENGANTGFVHQLLDDDTPVEKVAVDPVKMLNLRPGPHPRIPLPRDIYGDRLNSLGVDLSSTAERTVLARLYDTGESAPDATQAKIDAAFTAARAAQPGWDARGGAERARILSAMADALEYRRNELMILMVKEAGKTWPDAVGEVREAADFCRYYALLAERHFGRPETLKGPVGETNVLELHGRGVFACISPWNFPLAIFTGQVAAALASGNTVLAKPAEQTPRVAAAAVKLFKEVGLPDDVLHLVPGPGETVGPALVNHPYLAGIAFTGGTDTARAINRSLAMRDGALLPFIAETGGLNAMFVDTSAQHEQVLDDVILSAFGSAGQRCSALRILFLPEETAETLIDGLKGAMDVLQVSDPHDFATDIGPMIDAAAKEALEKHLAHLRATATIHKQVRPAGGHPLLFGPVMAEIALDRLPDREVFGPILHVIRYRAEELEQCGGALAARGYALTLGIHTRLQSFVDRVRALVPVGNTYVNRSIIGAVVGVQPFGGEGLSGTGPKAGGPHALFRYAVERALSVNIAAQGGDPALLNME